MIPPRLKLGFSSKANPSLLIQKAQQPGGYVCHSFNQLPEQVQSLFVDPSKWHQLNRSQSLVNARGWLPKIPQSTRRLIYKEYLGRLMNMESELFKSLPQQLEFGSRQERVVAVTLLTYLSYIFPNTNLSIVQHQTFKDIARVFPNQIEQLDQINNSNADLVIYLNDQPIYIIEYHPWNLGLNKLEAIKELDSSAVTKFQLFPMYYLVQDQLIEVLYANIKERCDQLGKSPDELRAEDMGHFLGLDHGANEMTQKDSPSKAATRLANFFAHLRGGANHHLFNRHISDGEASGESAKQHGAEVPLVHDFYVLVKHLIRDLAEKVQVEELGASTNVDLANYFAIIDRVIKLTERFDDDCEQSNNLRANYNRQQKELLDTFNRNPDYITRERLLSMFKASQNPNGGFAELEPLLINLKQDIFRAALSSLTRKAFDVSVGGKQFKTPEAILFLSEKLQRPCKNQGAICSAISFTDQGYTKLFYHIPSFIQEVRQIKASQAHQEKYKQERKLVKLFKRMLIDELEDVFLQLAAEQGSDLFEIMVHSKMIQVDDEESFHFGCSFSNLLLNHLHNYLVTSSYTSNLEIGLLSQRYTEMEFSEILLRLVSSKMELPTSRKLMIPDIIRYLSEERLIKNAMQSLIRAILVRRDLGYTKGCSHCTFPHEHQSALNVKGGSLTHNCVLPEMKVQWEQVTNYSYIPWSNLQDALARLEERIHINDLLSDVGMDESFCWEKAYMSLTRLEQVRPDIFRRVYDRKSGNIILVVLHPRFWELG